MRVRLHNKLKPNYYTESYMINEGDGWRLPKKKGADADADKESCDICQGFNRA